MNISAPFIRRPVASILLAIALMVVGIVSYLNLSVAPLPQMAVPVIRVKGKLSGASAETMASSVSAPLIRVLGGIDGVDSIDATSSQGESQIVIVFKTSKDIDEAAREVQAAINKAQSLMPSGMKNPPTYDKLDPSSMPIMILTMTSDSYTLGEMYDVASNIVAQKLSQVKGVGEVSVGGSSAMAVRVDLNPKQLSAYQISLDDVRQTINKANQTNPKGFIANQNLRWVLQTNSILHKAADYRDLVVRWQDGRAVRLKDVANVYDSVENEYSGGFYNNKQAINLIIRRQEGANIIETVDAVKAELTPLREIIPPQISLDLAQDRTPSIRATLHEAEITLLIAIVLVVLVVLVFLRNLRATLIPAISVPLSLLGTAVIMYLMNFSLNTISLMAFIVATGFVVDDSIVVVENIARYLEKGEKPLTAALKGTQEVGFTVVSMSVSLVVVFLPLLLIGDMIGRLFFEFAITLSGSILVSMVISLTITPSLCALWLRPNDLEKASQRFAWVDHILNPILNFYRRTLPWALKYKGLTLLTLLAAIVLNVYLFISIPKGFFPTQDTGAIMGFFQVDQGSSFKSMMPKLEEYRRRILQDPDVAVVTGYAGGRGGSNTSSLNIQLIPFSERSSSMDEVINRLRKRVGSVPGANLFLVAQQDIFSGGRATDSTGDYQYMIRSGDLSVLREWTPKIREALKALPELTDVSDDVESRARRLEIDINRDVATRLGVSVSTIADSLNNMFSRREISTIYENLNQYYVVLGVAEQFAQDSQILNELYITLDDGRQIPLSTIARFVVGNAPLRVNQKDGMLADSISFNLAPGVSLDKASDAIDKAMQKIDLPEREVQVGFEGNAQTFQKMAQQQPIMFLGVFALLYLVLGILYESYVHPFTILSTLPSAGLGAFLALRMANMQFTLIALIGVFLLIGIVKKNAIILIDFALQKQRDEQMSSKRAIYEACLVRFRPILMTSLAAILGAFPLIFATGAGVEMRQPLGITIVGGLIISQILTLYSTPVVYLYLDQISQWWQKRHPPRVQENDGAD